MDYHEQVRQNYLRQAKDDHRRYKVIDASRAAEAVHADVMAALQVLAD
jgi:thymidylate kinase